MTNSKIVGADNKIQKDASQLVGYLIYWQMNNQGTVSTGGSIVSECRLEK